MSATGQNIGTFSDAAILAAFGAGTTYLNLHTLNFRNGELRGDVMALSVPEPVTMGLLSIGLAGLVWAGGRRRRLG